MSKSVRVGIDVGGTSTKLVGVDHYGAEVGRRSIPTVNGDVEALVGSVADSVVDMIGRSPISAVGIGCPGSIDHRRGTVAHAVNLGIDGAPYPLGPALAEAVGTAHWAIENDVAATALAATDRLNRDHPGRERCVYLNLGTGVSAALVEHGTIVRAAGASVCEIGHIPRVCGGSLCPCGASGCLETVIAGPALAAAWTRVGGKHLSELFEAPATDDGAESIKALLAVEVVHALHWIAALFRPRAVILGGGVARLGGANLANDVNSRLAAAAAASAVQQSMLPDVPVVVNEHMEMLGAYGALRLLDQPADSQRRDRG